MARRKGGLPTAKSASTLFRESTRETAAENRVAKRPEVVPSIEDGPRPGFWTGRGPRLRTRTGAGTWGRCQCSVAAHPKGPSGRPSSSRSPSQSGHLEVGGGGGLPGRALGRARTHGVGSGGTRPRLGHARASAPACPIHVIHVERDRSPDEEVQGHSCLTM